MNNKNAKITMIIAVLAIIFMVGVGTYAFFAPQTGGSTSTNATVTSNTTDLLTFSINRDISFTVNQANFEENGQNQSGDATATATLTPNNKTGAATMNYYLYLNIESNPTVYSESNTNHDPELMLQVFDGNNQLVTLTGLGIQKTIKGVTGYDITGVTGLKTLLDNHAISASNSTATIENWKIVITLINLDVNQNDNTGKTIDAELIIQSEPMNLGLTGIVYRNGTNYLLNGRTIQPATYQVYCAYSNLWGNNTCNDHVLWDDLAGCEEFLQHQTMGNYVCQQESRSYPGIGEYTTNPSNGVYLKHFIVNDIVQDTEVCAVNNGGEVCINANYWEVDQSTTQSKLVAEMKDVFGVDYVSCQEDWDDLTRCNIDDLLIEVYEYGNPRINNIDIICEINGASHCYINNGDS